MARRRISEREVGKRLVTAERGQATANITVSTFGAECTRCYTLRVAYRKIYADRIKGTMGWVGGCEDDDNLDGVGGRWGRQLGVRLGDCLCREDSGALWRIRGGGEEGGGGPRALMAANRGRTCTRIPRLHTPRCRLTPTQPATTPG